VSVYLAFAAGLFLGCFTGVLLMSVSRAAMDRAERASLCEMVTQMLEAEPELGAEDHGARLLREISEALHR